MHEIMLPAIKTNVKERKREQLEMKHSSCDILRARFLATIRMKAIGIFACSVTSRYTTTGKDPEWTVPTLFGLLFSHFW